MTQKKKTDFKIVTPPDDLSEVRAKTKKIHREKRLLCRLFLLLLR